MQTQSRYVTVYTEANPNPQALKFVVNYMLVGESEHFEFDRQHTDQSPFAAALLAEFPEIEKVFISANFFTLTKQIDASWEALARPVKQFIQAYLEQNQPLLKNSQLDNPPQNSPDNDSPVVRKIKAILEEYVKPAVEQDGGAITFHAFDEASGQVKVRLQGACSGCPSSSLTLKAGIENLLRRMVPEVKEVVAEGA